MIGLQHRASVEKLKMGFLGSCLGFLVFGVIGICVFSETEAFAADKKQATQLIVDAQANSGRQIPETLFGIFFEEINHAGAGGIWSELVNNRGFEAGGLNTPSNIDPWSVIGNESQLIVSTDRSSCFPRNQIALRMEVLCNIEGSNICPSDGVGIYNPGFWGMNIEQGQSYKVVFYIRSTGSVNLTVAFTSSDGLRSLATANVIADSSDVQKWTKKELLLESKGSDDNAILSLTTTQMGSIWIDQVSAMPLDTYKGHGFREGLLNMLADIKPRFMRFPGGCYVEGEWLRNAFRWRASIGPWETRPGHFGDVWGYWTDDGLGYFEFLQLAEDLGALPIWVVNNGISHTDQVASSSILPFVKDALDSIEFAIGDSKSKWGSVRAAMGHPEPFPLKYVAIGNEDCGKKNYKGNYMKFYSAFKNAYPDIKIISNCDGSSHPLDHPADLYDFHVYTSASKLFKMAHQFDNTPRTGPKIFVSEYAVNGKDAGTGSLLAAIAEAGFLIGLEKNSDIVEMASYAPLFVNSNDRRWNPDAIVFNSSHHYGTPSYWVQQFFKESNGATVVPSLIQGGSSNLLISSSIIWQSSEDDNYYLRIKVVNFGDSVVPLNITITGLSSNSIRSSGSKMTVLTSNNVMDENSFENPSKVLPFKTSLENVGPEMNITLSAHSVNAIDVAVVPELLQVI
ncbi:alpha-L-arabinofuranosidase 1 isoform X1 [Amborella trichopoda]|uniref:alpha-L-arabinofuranosidase 1 isoform X1 n=2 Tax=Amborella trichopoda TaxID=13333 RepID=UPI0009BEABE8|nr:alpha-L-arabinofuranosidase 1 isoform X1 [Amborella trichopoda]|eukprot:XP_020518003.1 alpha-L-arabinofuranosidase 1 isoform X1 [Amborella trichopoda]